MDTHFPIIGITGGIGSGKSVVSRLLRALDIPVYDCDTQAKRLTLCSPLIRERLTALLGEEAYCDNGQRLNKPLIADFLFHSAGNAQKLNSIIHPVVRDDFLRWAGQKKAQHYPAAGIESAILYESGFYDLASEIWQVEASEPVRTGRIVSRDGLTPEEALRKIRFQQENTARELPGSPATLLINEPDKALFPQVKQLLSRITG